ncbi:CC_3452 family protein [Phenylobacterium sp. VNQ135]|uniref:CC_3452 family protein n=1 Tax=Phenylobacterium sp. VNQ135 TaxID=3400922 RepID=UPI003C0A894E
MKLRTLAAACAALTTLAAGSAFAADAVTAKLQAPVAEKTKFIAGGAMFVCEADACVATAPTSQTFATATCKTIASKVGAVSSFAGRKSLEDAKLADCNSKAVAKADGTQLAKQ